ncbi:MAG: restriction endonuclease [Crocinitomicaceae bacterium]|nr:restriction endonuclease [Crocinitomicaceae bacterium]
MKSDFLNNNVHPSLINPSKEYLNRVIHPPARQINRARRLCDKELKLAGFLKTKRQDISIIPNNIHIAPQQLTVNTMMNGFQDIYGAVFTESILSINVRSQLSSIWKNFDTLYERTFAEALNLHQRLPNMVLGEVYLIPVKEYTNASTVGNMVFNNIDIGKYIAAFQAINSRVNHLDEKFKYERCCLLIVDFDRAIPKIYNTSAELIQDGFLPQLSTISMAGLDYQNFAADILNIYTTRFPANTFI